MKNKLWLYQVPTVLFFTAAYLASDLAYDGRLKNTWIRESLRRVSATFTDFKFRMRGPVAPKNRIVIVDIDEAAIQKVGRWPWHRDRVAALIDSVFSAGASVVGLDMFFSEPDVRVPPLLGAFLRGDPNLKGMASAFETDPALASTIAQHADRLVLGWTSESVCSPYYVPVDQCPVTDPEELGRLRSQRTEKFTVSEQSIAPGLDLQQSKMASFSSLISNLPSYTAIARHAGFINAEPDPDGHIRRGTMAMLGDGRVYPSLALEMARVHLGEDLRAGVDSSGLTRLGFRKSGWDIPVNALGFTEANYRGPSRTFTYISAADLLEVQPDLDAAVSAGGANEAAISAEEKRAADEQSARVEQEQKNRTEASRAALKDSLVLIGVSAIGAFDMRAFPFDSNTPGVEGHATILDNLLARDFLIRRAGTGGKVWMFLLMVVGALAFAYATERLESVPALLLFVGAFTGVGLVDLKALFANNVNWDTSFLYLELLTIFACTIAAKYVLEEKSKKFVKGAFSKYVAPAVVDSIMKDPSKLAVGGEKRQLTILFSDIRGFTTFSEKMDAKALSSFLNDYLGIMTAIVFKHRGTLDKYIGDAVMAFWGAPLEDTKHASHCADAAREMMAALGKNRERWRTQYGVDVQIGIGFNSGVVSVGNMGAQENFSYTVIGDDVNLASRLEGLTKPYGVSILTTRFSFDAMKEAGVEPPPHRVLDLVKVKGKKKAVELIQIIDGSLPAEGLALFAEGRALYAHQRFDDAAEKFKAAGEILGAAQGGNDGPSLEFMGRCRSFRDDPPGADWDGSWEMHSK